jgi:hypothetical protein
MTNRGTAKWGLPILLLFYCLATTLVLKICILWIFLVILLSSLPSQIHLDKISRTLIVVLPYTVVFFFYPFCIDEGHFQKSIASLCVIVLGFLLLFFAIRKDGAIRLIANDISKTKPLVAILFWVAILLNAQAMMNSISYRGDEDFHIAFTILNFQYVFLGGFPVAFVLLMFVCCWLYAKFRKERFITLMLMAGVSATLTHILNGMEYAPVWIERYPPLFYIFNMVFSVPITALVDDSVLFQEWYYRLFAVTNFVLLAAIVSHFVKSKSLLVKLSFGICILTIPAVHYYASLTYIESMMLALAFIIISRFEESAERVIREDSIDEIIICTMLLGYIKETAIIYLAVFNLCFAYCVFSRHHGGIRGKALTIARYMTVTLVPSITYLYFRNVPKNQFLPNFDNIWVADNYLIILRSMVDQFGILMVIPVAAMVILVMKKRYFPAVLNSLIICGFCLFYILNGDLTGITTIEGYDFTGTIFMGYSRFNLLFLPVILYLSVEFINMVAMRRPFQLATLCILTAFLNIVMSPVSIANGLRTPGWGDYTFWTSELDYPYNALYKWISRKGNIGKIAVVGRSHPYKDIFYQEKWGLRGIDIETFDVGEAQAQRDFSGFDRVVCHEEPPFLSEDRGCRFELESGYSVEKVFEKGDLRLKLYRIVGAIKSAAPA